VGFFQNTHSDSDKVKHLKDSTFLELLKDIKSYGNYKINIYRNCQQPGTLWYHDHAMGVTTFNVGLGLHSYYVIRNSSI
jgi:spore coat protein A